MNQSTISKGDAKWNTCWRQACYLASYIYQFPDKGFSTQYPEKIAEVDRHWEEWELKDQNEESGMVGGLFKLKNWDPKSDIDPTCAPCLVFRGTDFTDMRGLAITASVKLRALGMVGWSFDICHLMDTTIPAKKEWVPGQVTPSGRAYPNIVPYTEEDLVNMGFQAVPIYEEEGWVNLPGATDGLSVPVKCTVKLNLMGKPGGDWYSNIFQGLGLPSTQYESAKTYGRSVIREFINPEKFKKLEISGHSLGGGLAAAVCCDLASSNQNIDIHGITFNAAGVHKNTVDPADLSDGNIVNFTVLDEPLTTVQNNTPLLPLIGKIFDLAQKTIGQRGMPPSLGQQFPAPGRSPGGPYGSKGQALPTIWPIQKQNVVSTYDNSFPILTAIDGLLSNSNSATDFTDQFIEWLNANYREEAVGESGFVRPIWEIYKKMFDKLKADAEIEISTLTEVANASVAYHGMDYVIATYDAEHPPRKA